MDTVVNMNLTVPVGYSLDEFMAKVNGYVARLAKARQEKALQKARLNEVMSIGGAFSACNTTDDWKKEKAEYLEEKYCK